MTVLCRDYRDPYEKRDVARFTPEDAQYCDTLGCPHLYVFI